MQSPNLPQVQSANFKRVVFLSVCFMTLFTAFCSAQNLAGQLYSQLGFGNLGQICLFIVFGTVALTSPIAAHYKNRIPMKAGLLFGALCYASFIFAGTFTSYCAKYGVEEDFCHSSIIYILNIASSGLVGIGGAFLWLFQSTYVNDCADESTKGVYNGTFWTIFQCCQILSSIAVTTILGMYSQFTFYSILTAFALIAIVMFFFVRNPVQYMTDIPTQPVVDSFGAAMLKFHACLCDKECHFFFIGLLFSGFAIGSYIAFLGAAVSTTVDSTDVMVINKSIGLVLVVLAFGEIAAGLSMGKLADKFEKINLFNITILINEAAVFFTISACVFKSYSCAIMAGFLFGYGDTGIQTMIGTVIGSVFHGRLELFSAYRFFQSFGMMFSCGTAIFVPKTLPMMYLTIIAAILLMAHAMFSKLAPKQGLESAHTSWIFRLFHFRSLIFSKFRFRIFKDEEDTEASQSESSNAEQEKTNLPL